MTWVPDSLLKDLFRLDQTQGDSFGAALTAWIAGLSLPLLLLQLVLNYFRGVDRTGILVSLLALLAMGSVLLLTISGRTRPARVLLPTFGFIAANAFLLTADNLTPILFVANNATVSLLAGAVLSHAWVLVFSLASAGLAVLSLTLVPAVWLVAVVPSSHGWETAAPLFLFVVLFVYLTTWQRSRAQRNANLRAAELDTLRQASATVTASLDLDKTIERILLQLHRVVPYDSASVQVLDSGQLEIIGGRGWERIEDVIGLRFPIPGDNPNSIVIETAQPYILNDAPNQHPEFRKKPHDHIQSWMGIPLRIGDRITGMLSVEGSAPGRFGVREASLALAFADAVAIALENANHFEAEQRRRQLAAMQLDILQVAGSSLQLEPLLEQVAGMTAEAAQALFSSIYLTPPGESQLNLSTFHVSSRQNGSNQEALQGAFQQLGSSSNVRQALDHHRVTVLDRDGTAAALPSEFGDFHQVTGLLLAPLHARQGVLGAIILGVGDGKDSFDADEITLIETISHSIAASIENARLYSQTERMAITDSLTGLYNRRGLFQFGQREAERSRRYERPISVLMVDLDHFKLLNDSYGHVVGDEVLVSVASRINQSVRRIDIAGRYGGEEFLVLLPECALEFAVGVAERIRQGIENDPISSAVGPIQVSVSLGVASSANSPLQLEELIQRADGALYHAKQAGRNCVRVWEPAGGEPPEPANSQEQRLR